MLRRFGWPSTNRSDPELAFNAWLLTQHADRTPSLQACLKCLGSSRAPNVRRRI